MNRSDRPMKNSDTSTSLCTQLPDVLSLSTNDAADFHRRHDQSVQGHSGCSGLTAGDSGGVSGFVRERKERGDVKNLALRWLLLPVEIM